MSRELVELLFEQYCAPRNRTIEQIARQAKYGSFSNDPLSIISDTLTLCVKSFGIKHRQNFVPPHIILEAETQEDIGDALIRQKSAKIIDLDDETSILQTKIDALERENARQKSELSMLTSASMDSGGSLYFPARPENTFSRGHLFLSDFHIGKVIKSASNNFNISQAYSNAASLLNSVLSYADAFGLSEIVVHMLGDMVDGPAGTMHADQQVDQDVHFDEQIATAGELLANFILALNADRHLVKNIYCIGGNHGRFTRDRKESPVRMADNLCYRLMAAHFDKSMVKTRIAAKEDYYVCVDGETVFIAHHGDKMPKKPLGTIFEIMHAEKDLWGKNDIVWVQGHTHTPHFEQLQSGVSLLKNGSFCGPDEYAMRIGKGSKANQTLVIVNEDGGFNTPIFMNL